MRFEPGDRVRTRNANPDGHTRLPAYLRAREGRIERALGAFPFPDERAAGRPDAPEHMLYTVRFEGDAVWDSTSQRLSICADLFEPYLEEVQ